MYFTRNGFSANAIACFVIFTLAAFSGCVKYDQKPLHLEVNPFIGTGGHGHTYPGATTPFGMVQLSPDTRLTGWDGCGGYHYSDTAIYGFSHTHLQGTGVSDYGDILFMPCTKFKENELSWPDRYKSRFSHDREKASAGHYHVDLLDHGISVDLTSTTRVGIHRYQLEEPDTLTLIVDMNHRDELVHYSIYPIDDTTLVGHRVSDNWAREQHVYFAARFDRSFEWRDQLSEVRDLGLDDDGRLLQEMEFVPVFACDFGIVDELNARVALSFVSIEGALRNLEAEAKTSDFDHYKNLACARWDDQLSSIIAEGGDENKRKTFYSALYHCFTTPNIANDVDGLYRGTDLNVHELSESEGDHYTVFSLWDTYRALHPLLNWIEPQRSRDFIRTMLRMYEQGGQLPVWELAANYTGCMIGYHSVPVIVDAVSWDIDDFDQDLALRAMLQAADSAHLGLTSYIERGYIPLDEEHESVSKTLEYAYDDACIASFAHRLSQLSADGETNNYPAIANRFENRALSYRNLFNSESGFIQPKRGGAWLANFEPREVNFNYTEANGWQYNFYVPHDINGHIKLVGGDEHYEALLDSMFQSTSETTGRNQPDITGMIGQYAHGNEPSHHMAYLYAYTGNHKKTTKLIDQIQKNLYQNAPDGLSGNEDCGQMSAWHVWSALGMYPVCPGSDQLVAGIPSFQSLTVTPNAEPNAQNPIKALIIEREGDGPAVNLIETVFSSAKSSVNPLSSWFSKREIQSGGAIQFKTGTDEKGVFGASIDARPTESSKDDVFVGVPVIDAPMTFRTAAQYIPILPNAKGASIEYQVTSTLDFDPNQSWSEYTEPLIIDSDAKIWARSVDESGRASSAVSHQIRRISHDWTLKLHTNFDPQYAASGSNALIDGISGPPHYQTGDWQGFWGEDVQGVLDLKSIQRVQHFEVGALRDIRPWIFLPREVQVEVSLDSVNWRAFGKGIARHSIANDEEEAIVHRFQLEGSEDARYVRFDVSNFGPLPDEHLGAGNPSWVFLDEIRLNID
jgi:predicted alpha-1,2-mannosidase